jgi:hypothetical protein
MVRCDATREEIGREREKKERGGERRLGLVQIR